MRALSDQIAEGGLEGERARMARQTQSLWLFQVLAGGDPPGGDDVRTLPFVIAAKYGGPAA